MLATGYSALKNFTEFIKVGIGGRTENYHFGEYPSNAWYYKSAHVYAVFSLTGAMIFLSLFLLILYGRYKNNRRLTLLPFAAFMRIQVIFIVSTLNR